MTRFYSDRQIADLFGVSHRTVQGWRLAGLLAYHNIPTGTGRKPLPRVSEDDLEAFLKQHAERVPTLKEIQDELRAHRQAS